MSFTGSLAKMLESLSYDTMDVRVTDKTWDRDMPDHKMKAQMYYMQRDERWKVERPYGFQYVPLEDVPMLNTNKDLISGLTVRDMRKEKLDFEKTGIGLLRQDSGLAPADFYDKEKVKGIYLPHVREELRRYLNASSVHILEYRVRKRHVDFPISTGENYALKQPVTGAHIDFSKAQVDRFIEYLYGDDAPKMLQKHRQAFNLWKPLNGPLRDWPLAVCDASSVDRENDLELHDNIFVDHVIENCLVKYNPAHRWYYLREQMPSEMLVFRGTDSKENERNTAVPHCSFDSGFEIRSETDLRESIEVRAIAFYDEE